MSSVRRICHAQVSRRTVAAAVIAASRPAALPVGAKAPDFTTTGALGGKPSSSILREQLSKGPVVLYFFPKAFTSGCTAEAHAFSEPIADFKKAGAQVIGMSADNLADAQGFLGQGMPQCLPGRDRDPGDPKAYDVAWSAHPGVTTRTSYVIDRSGKIVMVHDDLDFSQHVEKTLAAVKSLKR